MRVEYEDRWCVQQGAGRCVGRTLHPTAILIGQQCPCLRLVTLSSINSADAQLGTL